MRIYRHYSIIDEDKATFYRHPIHEFNFTALDEKDKWTAYKFTQNSYDIWMPTHFKRICSVIDQLPLGLNFDMSQESELHFTAGLSQDLGGLLLEQSHGQSASRTSQDDSGLVPFIPRTVAPDISVSLGKEAKIKRTEKGAYWPNSAESPNIKDITLRALQNQGPSRKQDLGRRPTHRLTMSARPYHNQAETY